MYSGRNVLISRLGTTGIHSQGEVDLKPKYSYDVRSGNMGIRSGTFFETRKMRSGKCFCRVELIHGEPYSLIELDVSSLDSLCRLQSRHLLALDFGYVGKHNDMLECHTPLLIKTI